MAGGWGYILASKRGGTLYIGVTADIARRSWEHRQGVAEGFTQRYSVKRLVFVERHEDIAAAIQREKSLKRWPRAWKVALIESGNPDWNDLWRQLQA